MYKFNSHSRLRLRYSSDPRTLGYASTIEQGRQAVIEYLSGSPDFIGTPRQIITTVTELKRMFGQVYHRIDIETRDGQSVTVSEILDYVSYLDYDRKRKKGWL